MTSTSDHFDGRRFFNPTGPAQQPFSAVPRMLREKRASWPSQVDVSPRTPPARDGAAAMVTFIGHATFLIQTAAGNILTDPVYSERAGPFNLAGPAPCPAACRAVRRAAGDFDGPPQSQSLRSLRPHDAPPSRGAGSRRRDAARERRTGPVHRHSQSGRARLVAGSANDRDADHRGAGAPLLGADAVRSQSRAVGSVPAGRRRRPHLLRRGQRLRAVLPRDRSAPRPDRSGAVADRRV